MQHGFSRRPKQETLPNAIFVDEARNWTSLHEAAAAGDERRVELLLAGNIDRMAKESTNGNTALHEAAYRGYSRCVKHICTAPLPSKSFRKDKSKNKLTSTIEALHNGTLSIGNNEGLSALHLAVQNGHNQSCREILLAGADPDVQNNYGDTPLHTACRYGHAGATRILLSAECDPNKANLNGDTALHITCAMGRRKLTRILLEADAQMNITNAQGETAREIATRKNHSEILEILTSSKRIRNRKEKTKDKEGSRNRDDQLDAANEISWSPYGCHYFPDPRAFPSPKLETLPKDPLKKGEQYFLDLAGHIHKGPISMGNTCYCGPFFRHMENKLNCNRKSLKKYVNKTKERLGHKVQALAIKTNDQIEQLTRSMIADRIRCENRRLYLNQYLKRGERMRSTLDNQTCASRKATRTLSRCRSLEILEKFDAHSNRLQNSRSFDILEDGNVDTSITIYQPSEDHVDYDDENSNFGSDLAAAAASPLKIEQNHSPNETNPSYLEKSKLDALKLDFYKVSERLGDLLEKTTLIMEKESDYEIRGIQREELHTDYKETVIDGLQSVDNIAGVGEEKSSSNTHNTSFDYRLKQPNNTTEDSYKKYQYPNSSETSNPSQHSNSWEYETSPTSFSPQNMYKYYNNVQKNDYMLQSVIRAIQKDNQHTNAATCSEVAYINNVKYDQSCENQQNPMYVDSAEYHNVQDNSSLSPVAHIQKPKVKNKPLANVGKFPKGVCAPVHKTIYAELHTTGTSHTNSNNNNDPLLNQGRQMANNNYTHEYLRDFTENNVNGKVEKVEIRNCEIKSLKKPNYVDISNAGKVKELVKQLQNNGNMTYHDHELLPELHAAALTNIEKMYASAQNNYNNNIVGFNALTQNQHLENIYQPERKEGDDMPVTTGAFQNSSNALVNSTAENVAQSSEITAHSLSPRFQPRLSSERDVPKDAYFHELPHKQRLRSGELLPNFTQKAVDHATLRGGVYYADNRYQSDDLVRTDLSPNSIVDLNGFEKSHSSQLSLDQDINGSTAPSSSQLYKISQRFYSGNAGTHGSVLKTSVLPTSVLLDSSNNNQKTNLPPKLYNVKNISSLV